MLLVNPNTSFTLHFETPFVGTKSADEYNETNNKDKTPLEKLQVSRQIHKLSTLIGVNYSRDLYVDFIINEDGTATAKLGKIIHTFSKEEVEEALKS